MSWVAVGSVLRDAPEMPYLLPEDRYGEVARKLENAGFSCVTVDVPREVSERGLLISLGAALGFPGHFRGSWDSYNDLLNDMFAEGTFRRAVLLTNSHRLAAQGAHLLVRVIHLLCRSTEGIEVGGGGAHQLEYIFFGRWQHVHVVADR